MPYNLLPWERIIQQAVMASTVTNAVQTRFTMPAGLLYPLFFGRITAFTGGSVQINLRFGLTDADADAALSFWQIGALGGAGASDIVAPTTFAGVPFAFVPGRLSVAITTVAATLTWELLFACRGIN